VWVPKPLVRLAGEPLIVRLLAQLANLGCETLTCMVRQEFAQVFPLLQGQQFGPPLAVRPCHTPSSMHTLAEGLRAVPPGLVFCSMVDTVMPKADWRRVYAGTAAGLAAGADAVLAVTPFVDDESPVYVSVDGAGLVQAVSDEMVGPPPPLITGGVYGFGPAARQAAEDAMGQGVQRMRGFLKWLVARGNHVATVAVPRIIDIDHRSDLHLANAWLDSAEMQG
jgi:NDP-sugar pyrophosphorylase family protein